MERDKVDDHDLPKLAADQALDAQEFGEGFEAEGMGGVDQEAYGGEREPAVIAAAGVRQWNPGGMFAVGGAPVQPAQASGGGSTSVAGAASGPGPGPGPTHKDVEAAAYDEALAAQLNIGWVVNLPEAVLTSIEGGLRRS